MGTASDKGGVEPPHSKALRALSLHEVPVSQRVSMTSDDMFSYGFAAQRRHVAG